MKTGIDVLHDPSLNKGTAFTAEERRQLGLVGLLPPHISTMADQVNRVLANIRSRPSDLDKYVEMISLLDRNETLFYRVLIENIEELMPIVYTPVVGHACQLYGHIFRRSRGLFITHKDRGHIKELLTHWPHQDVRTIVVTDGARILGLGDLGANGMGIPVGKLALYTACGGVAPEMTLPILIDVGTNNRALLDDPLYLGLHEPRLKGPEYDSLIEEFVGAVQQVFPKALIQFEDFANHDAFRFLAKYRSQVCSFNDDIQGTAAVALAGLLASTPLSGRRIVDEKILFLGAGEAAIGIADLTVSAMMKAGLSEKEAVARCWFVDSRGLVVAGRPTLEDHKKRYAHPHAPVPTLLGAVKALKPTALIGVSGQPQTFTKDIVEEMARLNQRPVIFALSNPTANAECTAEQAYTWSQGRALFASGSPFANVRLDGKSFSPGQGNNAYIFPGVGLGVLAGGASRVTDAMFLRAAEVLAGCATEKDLAEGRLYPRLSSIRDVSARIASAVSGVPIDKICGLQYQPVYRRYA